MDRTVIFTSSLPWSGSTFLHNILAQNPRFDFSKPTGLLPMMLLVRNRWNNMVVFKASPNEEGKTRVLKGMFESFHGNGEAPISFERSNGWPAYAEMAETVYGKRPKILVNIRDLREIVASFEVFLRTKEVMREALGKIKDFPKQSTLEPRCAFWTRGDQSFGLAYNQLRDVLARGYRDCIHFVDYGKLLTEPRQTLRAIYEFLEEKEFEHNLNEIRSVIPTVSTYYGVAEPLGRPPGPEIKGWTELVERIGKKYPRSFTEEFCTG